MPRPTLAPRGVFGVLVPWGNTTTQLEIEPLTPTGMTNAIARFDFGPATPERLEAATENFRSEGIDVVKVEAMDVGPLPNIESTPLDAIADAFRAVDSADVEAFVQVGMVDAIAA